MLKHKVGDRVLVEAVVEQVDGTDLQRPYLLTLRHAASKLREAAEVLRGVGPYQEGPIFRVDPAITASVVETIAAHLEAASAPKPTLREVVERITKGSGAGCNPEVMVAVLRAALSREPEPSA